MNKSGSIGGNFIFGMMGLFILILVATILIAADHSNEINANESIQIIDGMQSNFHIKYNPDNVSKIEYSGLTYPLMRIIYSFIDFTIYSALEVTKIAIDYSFNHQDVVNAKLLIILILLSLISPMALIIIKIIIIAVILTKEIIQSRIEKRAINNIKFKSESKQ